MTGKYNLKDIGVVYLDELTSQDLPAGEASTGILSWDGTGLSVRYSSNNQDVDVVFPTTDSLASTKTGVLAQNVGVSGFTSVQAPTTETLGTVYLAAGTLESALCAGYMKLENSSQNHPKTDAVVYLNSLDNLTTYGTLNQSLQAGAGSVENVIAMSNLVAIPSDGWYRLEANVDQASSTVTLYGLRLGYT
jgi:hypothetical protein